MLLDVREPFENELCNLGGQLIPLSTLSKRIGELDTNQFIIIYCKTGTRSQKAAILLEMHGFQKVRVLNGGILAWINEIDSNLKKY